MNSSTGAWTNSTIAAPWIVGPFEVILFSVSLLVGFPTHCYVLWLIVQKKGSGLASEFLNLNLSVCEIVACLDFLFFILANWVSFVMLLALFLQGLLICGRPLFQCLMCVERYLAVVHPVTFLKYKPLRYRLICCAVTWIIILVSCFVCLFALMLNNLFAHTLFFSVQFFFFLCIQLFCLGAILRVLKKSGPGDRKKEEENRTKRRAFNLILITTLNTIFAYVPIIISGVFIILIKGYKLTFWAPSMVCFVLAGYVHPVLYMHRAGKLSRHTSCVCSTL